MTTIFLSQPQLFPMDAKPLSPIIPLDTIDDYLRHHGLELLHPQVAVLNFRQSTPLLEGVRLRYGLYGLWFKRGKECMIRYGRQSYDYQAGTVVSFAPGQVVEVQHPKDVKEVEIIGLLFHPDLLRGTALGAHIGDYHFFDYEATESLHLSEREQRLFLDTLDAIQYELEQPIDPHSRTILVDRIKLLLDYCLRFYDRQFITRHVAHSDVLSAFDVALREYFDSGRAEREGLPSVGYFAEKAYLSAGYFSDLVKRETGMQAGRYIQERLLERSKVWLLDERYSITQVAERLGFQHPQHFTRFFKRHVGVSPSDYRLQH